MRSPGWMNSAVRLRHGQPRTSGAARRVAESEIRVSAHAGRERDDRSVFDLRRRSGKTDVAARRPFMLENELKAGKSSPLFRGSHPFPRLAIAVSADCSYAGYS